MSSSRIRVTVRTPDAAADGLRPDAIQEDALILDWAAELVARGWCQRALARDTDGRQVEPWADSARRWSPLGALLTVWYERGAGRDAFAAAYTALALATGGRVEEWNSAPWRSKAHVLSAFRRARVYLPAARERNGRRR